MAWTRQELDDILDRCYDKRWRIGKDAMWAVRTGLLEVLRLMEDKKVYTVDDALGNIDYEDEEYPL